MADDHEMMSTEPATTPAPPSKGTWNRLLRIVVVATIVLMILIILLAGEVIPPFVIFMVLFAVGWGLLSRGGKAGPIVLIVAFVLWLALNAPSPFIFPVLFAPTTAGDFIIAVATIALGIVGLVCAIAVLRGRDAMRSGAPRKVGIVLVAVIVLSVAVGVIARATYEAPAEESGDFQLTTVESEFDPKVIEVDGGEVSIYVTNDDDIFHTFTIDELEVDELLPGGVATRITFEAEPGTYRFYCTPHAPDMEGEIIIE